MVRVNNTQTPDDNSSVSSGYRHLVGTHKGKLLEAHMIIMRNELRLWLLKSLISRDLATPDVYNFAKKKQGLLRCLDKRPDKETIRVAMNL